MHGGKRPDAGDRRAGFALFPDNSSEVRISCTLTIIWNTFKKNLSNQKSG